MRKTWMKPKLVVLVRGTADERVLEGCKSEYPDNGPESIQADCYVNGDYCGPCNGDGDMMPNPN
jgi:hypothetical protein